MNGTLTLFSDSLKIAVVSHALVIPVFQNRWKKLSQDSKYDIHLLVPEYWEQTWFGEKVIYEPNNTNEDNFKVHPMATTSKKNWSFYLFKSLGAKLKQIKPDLIYIIHEEGVLIHQQIYLYKKLFAPQAKIIFFSMNALGVPGLFNRNIFKRAIRKWMWHNVKKYTSAALVHYPGCEKSLRNNGYKKPIFLQTQVGVDESLFAPQPSIRKEYKKLLNFEQHLVIGYSGRLTKDKGVDDLVKVFIELKRDYTNIALLLVGNGDLRVWIETQAKQHDLEGQIHITGFVAQDAVPKFMNAMDIFVLGSKTTPQWIDTFPLVTVQAQAVRVAVTASNSGSIPWQLGESAKLFSEGNLNDLKASLVDLIESKELRREYAEKGQKRSHEYFCHIGMTENFKKIVYQVMHDDFFFHQPNEAYSQWKAY